jgi:hypothetical protein
MAPANLEDSEYQIRLTVSELKVLLDSGLIQASVLCYVLPLRILVEEFPQVVSSYNNLFQELKKARLLKL